MQLDVLGKFLSGRDDDVIDNFSLNFSSVAPFWETEFNKDVKIEYRTVPIKGVAEEMSKSLRESLLRQEAEQNGQGEEITRMLRGEFETWELIRCLNLSDRVYFKYQK